MFLISRDSLDCCVYNPSYHDDTTWERCSLRVWLNGTFLNRAFSADEKTWIAETKVSADKSSRYSTNPGRATKDKVYLLSITEAEKYFPTSTSRQCEPTHYANGRGHYYDMTYWWYLRSPGREQYDVAVVKENGDITSEMTARDYIGVRPVLWINLP